LAVELPTPVTISLQYSCARFAFVTSLLRLRPCLGLFPFYQKIFLHRQAHQPSIAVCTSWILRTLIVVRNAPNSVSTAGVFSVNRQSSHMRHRNPSRVESFPAKRRLFPFRSSACRPRPATGPQRKAQEESRGPTPAFRADASTATTCARRQPGFQCAINPTVVLDHVATLEIPAFALKNARENLSANPRGWPSRRPCLPAAVRGETPGVQFG